MNAKEVIMIFLESHPYKKIESVVIEDFLIENHPDIYKQLRYRGFYLLINELEQDGFIKKVKSSGTNKKMDALYKVYTITIPKEEVKINLRSDFHPAINVSYFQIHLKKYSELEPYLENISDFIYQNGDDWLPINERSFQLFRNEKWLDKNESVLKKIHLSYKDLRCFKTPEPFMYYARKVDDEIITVLIVENKDSFHTFKELLKTGYHTFFGIEIHLLIYGEGKKIISSYSYLGELEEYRTREFRSYYFGDLDPEGINIWRKLNIETNDTILPFIPFYSYVINTFHKEASLIPKDQNVTQQYYESFYSHFAQKERSLIKELLKEERYIPQEALNRNVLIEMSDCFGK
jgi:hypothetical protein